MAIGAWHGLNPGMGWPLAVAQGLSERRGSAVLATFAPLGVGHLLAMAVVLLPFAALGDYFARWHREIRIAAGVAVLLFGAWRFIDRRHPRWFARIRPTQLALWSFVIANAHGAGLMLLPFALGLCAPSALATPGAGAGTALLVAMVHTVAMLAVGLAAAWGVYRYAGLRLLQRGWLNLDAIWGASLVLTGAVSVGLAWGISS